MSWLANIASGYYTSTLCDGIYIHFRNSLSDYYFSVRLSINQPFTSGTASIALANLDSISSLGTTITFRQRILSFSNSNDILIILFRLLKLKKFRALRINYGYQNVSKRRIKNKLD